MSGRLTKGLRRPKNEGAHVQIIYRLLEQMLGGQIFPVARRHNISAFARVPHSSGLLEGAYTEQTSFGRDDQRSFRVADNQKRKAWLLDGLKKVEKLPFLTQNTGRSLGQAGVKFILAEPSIASVLPNIYKDQQLPWFAAAPDRADLKHEEIARLEKLCRTNFGLGASIKRRTASTW
jgi:aryl-alcohol dehydrogenase-like predicted oxidoreductase